MDFKVDAEAHVSLGMDFKVDAEAHVSLGEDFKVDVEAHVSPKRTLEFRRLPSIEPGREQNSFGVGSREHFAVI